MITARVLRPTKRKTHLQGCFVLIRVAKTLHSESSSYNCMRFNTAHQQRLAQEPVILVEPLINRSIRNHLAGTAPHTDLVKEKVKGTGQFEITVITDYSKHFSILHEVRGITKHLEKTRAGRGVTNVSGLNILLLYMPDQT